MCFYKQITSLGLKKRKYLTSFLLISSPKLSTKQHAHATNILKFHKYIKGIDIFTRLKKSIKGNEICLHVHNAHKHIYTCTYKIYCVYLG